MPGLAQGPTKTARALLLILASSSSFLQLATVSACSSTPDGTLQIVTGGETDTFSRTPAPEKLEVDSVDSSGTKRRLAMASLPTANIDLGAVTRKAAGTIEVSGIGADGSQILYGQSIPLSFGALEQMTVPIFVQRTGELARMPRPLSDTRPMPTLAVLAGRFLFVGAGSDPMRAQSTQLYDFASLTPLSAPPSLPRIPKSIAFVGTMAWLVDESGGTVFDFAKNTSSDLGAPAGGSFGDVAGGATVFATDGTQLIVGATRPTGTPTAAVLAVDPAGKLSWRFLAAPRQGAAATWVDGRGLVVAGGNANAAGVEVIAPGAMNGSPLPYPADPSTGTAASTLDAQHVLLAGGVSPNGKDNGVRAIDLGCLASCVAQTWTALPKAVAFAQAFVGRPGNALVVGNETGGATHVYRVTSTTAVEIPTKVPHIGARAIISPLGSIVLFGGATEIESFVP